MPHYDRPEDLPPRYRAQVAAEDRARVRAREAKRRTIESAPEPFDLGPATVDLIDTETASGAPRGNATPEVVVVYGRFKDGVECSLDGHGGWRCSLPLKAWGVNEERAQHWTKHRRRRTREARDFTRLALADRPLPHFDGPVEIEVQTYGSRLDALNDAPLCKAAVDALVDLGVLAGDSAKFVARYLMNAPVPHGEPRIVLEVRPYTPPTV